MYERLLRANDGLKVEGCGNPNCQPYSTDVFCEHSAFLPHVKNRWTVVAGLAIYAAFPFSAETGSILPIFVAGCLLGGTILALPLSRRQVTWVVALVGWVVACAIALGLHFSSGEASRPTFLILAVLTTSTWLHLLWRNFNVDAIAFTKPELVAEGLTVRFAHLPERRLIKIKLRKVSQFAAAVLGLGFSALTADAALALLRLSEGGQGRWPYVEWLLRAGVGAIAAGIAASVISGILFQKEIISPTKRVKPVHVKISDGSLQRKSTVTPFGMPRESILRVAIVVKVTFENARRVVCYAIAVMTDAIKDSVEAGIAVAMKTLKEAALSALKAARFSIVPVAGWGLASWLTVSASHLELQYLTRGAGTSVLTAAALGFLGVLCLTATWVALSANPVGECLRSATSSALHAAGYVLIFVFAGCWLVALPSTFLGGTIRIGWITWVTTALVLLLLISPIPKWQTID
ncbi:hypothetical protein KBZ00_18550 [Streptomyces sp. RK31]|uniref:hypothetical protein n=1 Tax=Streptomyces sp. RK31 TaxID=2824892 RepID=UPI001B39C80F|nr:hypothetical protein [Streptomyces sp. RK31]MBQ0973120.1 hypothetical protein [Streptomyces sp. RK31]